MRYSELRTLLEDTLAEGNLLGIEDGVKGGEKKLTGLHRLKNILDRFKDAPMFTKHFDELFKHELLRRAEDSLVVNENASRAFVSVMSRFITAVKQTLTLLLEMAETVDELCVRIRLPDSVDFSSAVGDQQTILKALEQVLLAEPFNAKIRLVGWENGSHWLTLSLGTILAVECLGRMMWAAAVIRKKKIEGDILLEQTRKIGVEGDFLKHLQEKTNKAADDLLSMETKALRDHYAGERVDHEAAARLKETIRTFADLFSRGAQVVPALMKPEQADQLFPDFKTLDTISSKIPQLKDTENGSDVLEEKE